jgi:hypothetical protein
VKNLLITISILALLSCEGRQREAKQEKKTIAPEQTTEAATPDPEVLQDKILGMLLGSAIGDAMGAPTEMWSRRDILIDYGYVSDLDTMVREPSAEGTWDFNLPAGGTTDDTRWKQLMVTYLLSQNPDKALQPAEFANQIINQYQEGIKSLKNTESFDPEPFEESTRRMAWLQEWAMVARPFAENDLQQYAYALSQFYGGEMTCAGMLYTPVVGAFYPDQAHKAYAEAFRISLFDLGYARDISALTAAMVSVAMAPEATPENIINVIRDVDPEGYFKSRLVGRTAYRLLREARAIVYEARKIREQDIDMAGIQMPKGYTDTLQFARTMKAYELLDARNQDMPFHAGEIHLVNLTALLFCDFDFQKTLSFVVNFGRDNDTTAAVTGAILGAYWGAKQLPEAMKQQVLLTNKQLLNTDLQQLAAQLASHISS